jgi:hypothetical protein
MLTWPLQVNKHISVFLFPLLNQVQFKRLFGVTYTYRLVLPSPCVVKSMYSMSYRVNMFIVLI